MIQWWFWEFIWANTGLEESIIAAWPWNTWNVSLIIPLGASMQMRLMNQSIVTFGCNIPSLNTPFDTTLLVDSNVLTRCGIHRLHLAVLSTDNICRRRFCGLHFIVRKYTQLSSLFQCLSLCLSLYSDSKFTHEFGTISFETSTGRRQKWPLHNYFPWWQKCMRTQSPTK